MADEAKVTKPTRYFILRRNRRTGGIRAVGEQEARGAEKALNDYLESEDVPELGEDESAIAVPVSNWTERGANVRTERTIELVDLRPLSLLADVSEPVEDDGA